MTIPKGTKIWISEHDQSEQKEDGFKAMDYVEVNTADKQLDSEYCDMVMRYFCAQEKESD